MKITILVEGKTEQAFKPHLLAFLKNRLHGKMPKIDPFPYHGRIRTGPELRRDVERLLQAGSDAVVALTDVYTGTNEFRDGADARQKMRSWVGNNPKFHPHVAQHDFEAWLLPFWEDIQVLAGHNRNPPTGKPETINHQHPPSWHIREIFRVGTCRDDYSKARDANRILRGKDLTISANACPEFKAFLNTLLTLSGGQSI